MGGGTLVMNDSSVIRGNTAIGGDAPQPGGGVYYQVGDSTLVRVICAPDANANVRGNTPDDCYGGP